MSWTRTTFEGKTCYEQNGKRLFRTQDIDALEEAERRNSEAQREEMQSHIIRVNEEMTYNNEGNQNSKYDGLIVLFMMIFFILMAIFNS